MKSMRCVYESVGEQDSWSHLEFSVDPLASAYGTEAQHLVQAGFATSVDLHGIFDLQLFRTSSCRNQGKANGQRRRSDLLGVTAASRGRPHTSHRMA